MHDCQNKGLTKWAPRRWLILKGRKFRYRGEQHVNFIKGKELDQKTAFIAMKTGVDVLYWDGAGIYK